MEETSGKEEKIKLGYKLESGRLKFSTSDLINDGIYLEEFLHRKKISFNRNGARKEK